MCGGLLRQSCLSWQSHRPAVNKEKDDLSGLLLSTLNSLAGAEYGLPVYFTDGQAASVVIGQPTF